MLNINQFEKLFFTVFLSLIDNSIIIKIHSNQLSHINFRTTQSGQSCSLFYSLWCCTRRLLKYPYTRHSTLCAIINSIWRTQIGFSDASDTQHSSQSQSLEHSMNFTSNQFLNYFLVFHFLFSSVHFRSNVFFSRILIF